MRVNVAANPGNIEPGWLTIVVDVAKVALGAAGLWLAQRTLGKAGLEQALNDRIKEIIKIDRDSMKSLREELKVERAARVSEQLVTTREHAQLRGEIANLNQTIESLTERLRNAVIDGLVLEPEAPKRRPKPMIEL
jgi:hypothetical protein